jgi:hypothetical protein
LQGSVSSPMSQTKYAARAFSADDRPSQTFDRGASEPKRRDRSRTDSISLRTDASTGSAIYYFYEPFPMETGASFFQVGASVSLVPYPDAEQEVPMPGLDFQYKRGLINNVSYVASFSTSIFSNLFHTGLQWNGHLDRFSFGFANHVGAVYGFITRDNLFDNVQAYGLFYMPMLRFGYRFDEFSFSSSFVISYVFKSNSYVNGLRASVGPQHSINDYYCTLVIEQPFLRNLHLSIGLSLGFARTPYQTWMLYNTIDEWLFVPEFFFAVQL